VTLVEPDEAGRVPAEAIETALRADTLLVSVMLANNETGVLNDVAQISARVRERRVLMHTDASQAVGKLSVDVRRLGVDLLSLTAHKFYGPKGIGALYVREDSRPRIAAVQFGGGHERGLRSGTLPTHQVAGFAAAAGLARQQGAVDAAHARDLARRLGRELETIPGVSFNHRARMASRAAQRLVRGVEGESLVTGLPEIAVSTGSACSSATREPSYVLRALGRSTELAQSSLRLSLGRFTTAADVDTAATAIRCEVSRCASWRAARRRGLRRAARPPDSSLATATPCWAGPEPAGAALFPRAARIPSFPRGGARRTYARAGPGGRRTAWPCFSS
jgi:cysteine desulfurase